MERDLHKKRDLIELPAGFRFHPSDEELITHYLHPKALDGNFTTIAIGDVDLNKVEPWDLPWKANMGENEWYFFCLRDRKYPTGLRTNRATVAGYWKATGKDKDILRSKTLIGMKKTLVFYRGRAPRGEKTDWVMHEFRLHGKYSMQNLPKTSKNEWVICRVFKKSSGGKKSEISELYRNRDYHCNTEDSRTSVTELSSEEYNPRTSVAEVERAKPRTNHVACFTENKEDDPQEQTLQEFNSRNSDYYHQFPFMLPGISTTDSTFTRSPFVDNLSCQKQSINGLLQENKNNGLSTKQNCDSVYLHEAWDDLDCLWN